MNTYLLGALVVAALLVAVGLLLLRRRGPRRAANDERRAATPAPVGRADAAAQAIPANLASPALPEPAVPDVPTVAAIAPASVDAQRLAATEALRQARQRKADEAARLEVERRAITQAPAIVQPPVQAPIRPPAQPQQPSPVQSPIARQAPPVPTRPPSAAASPAARPAERSAPLPRPPAIDAALAPAAARAGATPGPAPLRAPTRPAGPPTVLLADDSKVVRVKTGRLLERQGWRVLLAEDGLAALRQLDGEGADLLITDVEMPGIDGFELTRRVRAHPRWGRLPVIMITSSDDRHRDEAAAAGVDLLLGKPYEEDALLERAQLLLGGAAARTAPAVAMH